VGVMVRRWNAGDNSTIVHFLVGVVLGRWSAGKVLPSGSPIAHLRGFLVLL